MDETLLGNLNAGVRPDDTFYHLGDSSMRGLDAEAIAPLDPVSCLAQTVRQRTSETMVVGHLPFMGRLVSLFVAGNETATVATFRPGTVVCLERDQDNQWVVAWMIRPELDRPQGGKHE
jgi:phosphohistidine phosphatase